MKLFPYSFENKTVYLEIYEEKLHKSYPNTDYNQIAKILFRYELRDLLLKKEEISYQF